MPGRPQAGQQAHGRSAAHLLPPANVLGASWEHGGREVSRAAPRPDLSASHRCRLVLCAPRYEESKKEADKWLPIVKANREAPTIRFTADKSGATARAAPRQPQRVADGGSEAAMQTAAGASLLAAHDAAIAKTLLPHAATALPAMVPLPACCRTPA